MLHPSSQTHPLLVLLTGSLLDFFSVIAADPALVEGLKQKGPLSRCIQDRDPHKLAQDLMYLAVSRALPFATVRDIRKAFNLTKAGAIALNVLCMLDTGCFTLIDQQARPALLSTAILCM